MSKRSRYRIPGFASLFFLAAGAAASARGNAAEAGKQAARISIVEGDKVLAVIGEDFLGLHYDGPTHRAWDEVRRRVVDMPGAFGSPCCRRLLRNVGLRVARIFVGCSNVHPRPGEFDWRLTDARVAEVVESGMAVMLCLHQGRGKWFVGDEAPWWRQRAGREEWRAFVRACARRYRGKVRYYEILNEPNHLHKDKPNYMGWELSAALFMDAAREIKAVDPRALVGGAATWAAWESAEWARRVLALPDGERMLDFVSYHIYTSHHLKDTNEQILAKTSWFEEAPTYIRRELSKRTRKRIRIVLTEYNVSAVCSKDGKPFTDPRNVNTFGGVVTALALLYSARGGADMALHFGTMGGFGLIRWPPEYQVCRPYHALRLLYAIAGLRPGAQVLETKSSEPAREAGSCVRGKQIARALESFALRREGVVAVVLVNKRRDRALRAAVVMPKARRVALYRYSATRLVDAVYPLRELSSPKGVFEIECPPYSVSVLKFRRRGGEQRVGDDLK